MTENIAPTPTTEHDIDFDDWLAGGQRTAHYATLYARLDLVADAEELEKRIVPAQEIPEAERALGGDDDDNARNKELREQIDRLYLQAWESRREFRVTGLTTEEHEEIEAAVLKELSAELDTAAADGRAEAKKTAHRMGVTTAVDVNAMVRHGANERSTSVVNREVALRKLAKTTTVKRGDDWVPLTLGNVRSLYKALGQAQIDVLATAVDQATNDVPVVTVPKS